MSAGRPTRTSRPPRRSERKACSNDLGVGREDDGDVGAAEVADGVGGVLGGGVDRVGGAELAGESELLVDDVDGDDGAAGDASVLEGEVAEAADAEDADELAGADAADLDRLVGGDAGAGEGGGVGGGDAVGDASDEGGVGADVLGEAAVGAVARVDLALAERLPAGDAGLALAAGPAEPGDGDEVALGDAGDAGADALDDADAFVAGDEGGLGLDGPVAVGGVDVGVAQARGDGAHEDLAGADLGDGPLLDDEGGVEFVDDGCLHGGLPLPRLRSDPVVGVGAVSASGSSVACGSAGGPGVTGSRAGAPRR